MVGYIDFDITKKVLDDLTRMSDVQVVVGIPRGSKRAARAASTKGRGGKAPAPPKADTLDNADLAYLMEKGSPARNLPPRPFLLPGVKTVEKSNVAFMAQAGQLILAGRFDDAVKVLEDIGMDLENAVKLFMTQSGNFAPLAPRTLAARRSRGNSSTRPLKDTNQMFDAVTNLVIADGGRLKTTKSRAKKP